MFMKLGMYIMTPEIISWVYLRIISHRPICVCVIYTRITLLGNG
jgi:hypothetical protein